jgi:hypothetical protein
MIVFVCVCVCVRERERERQGDKESLRHRAILLQATSSQNLCAN